MEVIQENSFIIPQPNVIRRNKQKQGQGGFVTNCMTTMNGSNKMFTPRPATGTSCSTLLDKKRKTYNAVGEGSPSLSNKRQSLKVLQQTADNRDSLIGRKPQNDQDVKKLKTNLVRDSNDAKNEKNVMKKDQKSSCSSKGSNKKTSFKKSGSKTCSVSIFVDPTNRSSSDGSSSEPEKQTNTNDDIYAMLTNDEAPESYWKEIAEERRKALEATLEENKNLHNELNDLRTDFQRLKKVADQAEYFAGIIEDLLGKKVDESSDEDDKAEQKTTPNTECRKRKRNDDDDEDEVELNSKGARLYSSEDEDAVEENLEEGEDDEENSLFGSYV